MTESSKTNEFLRLFMANQRRIYAFILTMVPNHGDAEDLFQETVLLMWSKFDSFTPGSRIVDFGTEFGLLVGDAGNTEIHVFDGKIEFERADSGPVRRPQRLVKNEAVTIGAEGHTQRVPLQRRPHLFVRTMPAGGRFAVPGRRLSLADMVGAGNGLDTGVWGQGIDASTGQLASRRTILKKNDNGFVAVPSLPFIDGVLVPDSSDGSAIVTKGEWRDAYSLLIKGDTSPPNLLWTGNDTSIWSTDPVPLNEWTHVAVTINGSLANFYINGMLNGPANQNRGGPIDNNPADHTEIGREDRSDNGSPARWYFNGMLDDVRLYDEALPAEQIQEIMLGRDSGLELAGGLVPADGQTDVPRDVVLGWKPGPYAVAHDVYFGTSFADVNASSAYSADTGPEKTIDGSGLDADDLHGTAQDTMWLSDGTAPQPAWIQYEFDQLVKLQQMRVWNANQLIEAFAGLGARSVTVEYSVEGDTWAALEDVPEFAKAAGPASWPGDLWSFSTVEYLVIDDFEGYTDEEGTNSRIYETWIDGYADQSSGSIVGYFDAPFAEQTIVHGGRQSMPLYYDNSSFTHSEAQRTWPTAQNWTAHGADTLTLYVRGTPVGFAELSPSHILMNGMGTDIYGTADQGRFVYKQLTGDGSIVARVDRLDNTHAWAKAGVMIRRTLDASSAWAYVCWAGENGVRFQTRPTTGGAGASDTPVATPEQIAVQTPAWIKLERKGDQFHGYYATDSAGTAWTPMVWNPQTITMNADVYIGLAVTSHVADVVTQAEFSNVATTGSVTGPWQSASLGLEQPAGNLPDPLYLAVEDTGGRRATVVHPDPLAVAAGTWTPWSIPLSEFTSAGVKAESVRKIVIGIGDRTKPASGATGLIYIDDISYGRPVSP